MIVVLTGGTGGAKFVDGLRNAVAPEELTIVVNTGDDSECWGLDISPDIDSIVYMLAGMISAERGWGVSCDTFHCLQAMKRLGEREWFNVGDRDLATHLLRTRLMSDGHTLTQATQEILRRLEVRSRVLPMSDQRVRTMITTPAGEISFDEYFVRRRFRDGVISVRFDGADAARPAPGVLEAIAAAEMILIAPSNPVTSIGPILAVPGIREALRQTSSPVVAVSPIIGNEAVSGPAAGLMRAQGREATIRGVAAAYEDLIDVLIAHSSDESIAPTVSTSGLQVHCANIWMNTREDRVAVAETALAVARQNLSCAGAQAE